MKTPIPIPDGIRQSLIDAFVDDRVKTQFPKPGCVESAQAFGIHRDYLPPLGPGPDEKGHKGPAGIPGSTEDRYGLDRAARMNEADATGMPL